LIPFIGGIVTGSFYPMLFAFFAFSSLVSLIVVAAAVISPLLRKKAIKLFAFWHFFLFFCLGGALSVVSKVDFSDRYFGHFDDIRWMEVSLTEDFEEGENSYKVTGNVLSVQTPSGRRSTTGKILIYVRKSESPRWRRGDRYLIVRPPEQISGPQNPEEFDYQRYMYRRGITHRVFLRDPSEARLVQRNAGLHPLAFLADVRQNLISRLELLLNDREAFAVSAALILGQKEHLTPRIRSAYSGSGAMHVLAVSGLHVGIIYLILMSLLGLLGKSTAALRLRLLIVVVFLWVYAAITGLSPSVVRAATMFTAVAISQSISRKSSIYNTLASAALIMLCFKPDLLEEVGFQLSFAAVLAIVLLYPKIYGLWHFNHWITDKLWALTAVSIAAQVGTFPLGLYYFNQFPNYFLLSNFIVIPAAHIVLVLGGITLFVSEIHAIAVILGKLLNQVVTWLNTAILHIEQLPGAVSTGYISLHELLLLYCLIALLISFIYFARIKTLLVMLSVILMLLAARTSLMVFRSNTRNILISNVSGSTAINFTDVKHNILIADSILLNDIERQKFHLGAYWAKMGFENAILLPLADSGRFELKSFVKENHWMSFYKERILVENKTVIADSSILEHADWIVLTEKAKCFSTACASQPVILASGYKYRNFCCETHADSIIDVRKSGSFIIEIE
jgi:competence protein ComEC